MPAEQVGAGAALSQLRVTWNTKPHPQFLSVPDCSVVKPGVKRPPVGCVGGLRIYVSSFTVL